MTYATAERIALAGIAGAEFAAAADRFEDRQRLYALAQRRHRTGVMVLTVCV